MTIKSYYLLWIPRYLFYERNSRLDTFWNIMKGKELYLSKTIKVLDKQSKYSVANEQHSCLII